MPGSLGLRGLNILISRQPKAKMLISYNSRWNAVWEIIVVASALLIAIAIPFEITFGMEEDRKAGVASILLWFTLITDFIFLLDVLKSLNTTFLSPSGEEIQLRKSIILRYATRFLWIDCLTCFPWILAAILQEQAYIPMLLMSLTRIWRLFPRISLGSTSKLQQICKFGAILALLTHWCACLWFAIVGEEESWQPSSDVILLTDIYSEDGVNQYFVFLYYATIILVQGGELYPVPERDTMVITLMEIAGVLVFTLMFSKVSLIVQDSTSASGAFLRKLDSVESASLQLGLPGDLHRKLISSVAQQADSFQLEWFVLVHSLPESLFKEIIGALLAPVSGISAMKNFFDPRLEDKFLRLLKPYVCVPEEVLFHEFQTGDCVYFVCRGGLEATLELTHQKLFHISEGMMFGVSAAVSCSHKVCYTATALKSSLLFSLTSANIAYLTQSALRLNFHLKEEMQEENNFWLSKCLLFLKRLPYFADCSLFDTLELAIATRAQHFETGMKVAQRGKNLPYIVMVYTGKLAIRVRGTYRPCTLETLTPGSIYGIYTVSKATNTQRMDLVALEPSICLLLSQQTISELALCLPQLSRYNVSLSDLRKDDFFLTTAGSENDKWDKVRIAVIRILRGFYMRERMSAVRLTRRLLAPPMRNVSMKVKRGCWMRLKDVEDIQKDIMAKIQRVRKMQGRVKTMRESDLSTKHDSLHPAANPSSVL